MWNIMFRYQGYMYSSIPSIRIMGKIIRKNLVMSGIELTNVPKLEGGCL